MARLPDGESRESEKGIKGEREARDIRVCVLKRRTFSLVNVKLLIVEGGGVDV